MNPHAPRWRWRRADSGDPLVQHAADIPGPLGADGVTVEVTRAHSFRADCPVCGRRAQLWYATLKLPAPWGDAGFFQGCTLAHTTSHVPRTWRTVADGFLLAAEAVAREGRDSAWHRDRVALHRRQAALAAWVDAQAPTVRKLALALWAHDDDLTIAATETIVAAVLADPG